MGERFRRDVSPSLQEPRTDEIKRAAGFAKIGNGADLFALLDRLELCPHKRRVAQHVTAPRCRQHSLPLHLQRIAMHDVRRFLQRDPGVIRG
jgi:hypothetical protein